MEWIWWLGYGQREKKLEIKRELGRRRKSYYELAGWTRPDSHLRFVVCHCLKKITLSRSCLMPNSN